MDVVLKKKMPGLGNVGDTISVSPDRARRLVLGGLGDYVEDLPGNRKKATIEIPKKRGKSKKKKDE